MEIHEWEVVDLIKIQMKDQGCFGDTLEDIKLMQGHIYEWIKLFHVENQIKLLEGTKYGE